MTKKRSTKLTPEQVERGEAALRRMEELVARHAVSPPRRPALDETTRKRIDERAREILEEDPRQRHERVMRTLAEQIAYREVMAEQRRSADRRAETA